VRNLKEQLSDRQSRIPPILFLHHGDEILVRADRTFRFPSPRFQFARVYARNPPHKCKSRPTSSLGYLLEGCIETGHERSRIGSTSTPPTDHGVRGTDYCKLPSLPQWATPTRVLPSRVRPATERSKCSAPEYEPFERESRDTRCRSSRERQCALVPLPAKRNGICRSRKDKRGSPSLGVGARVHCCYASLSFSGAGYHAL
jgi:hypothetical protein